MPAARRKPQDRKTKAGPFTFTHVVDVPATATQDAHKETKTFTLPSARVGAQKVKGRILRDAALNGDGLAQTKLGLAMLEACGASDEAIDALYDKGAGEMTSVLERWMNADDGEGTVPQS